MVNLQHDCSSGSCEIVYKNLRQEREQSLRKHAFLQHADNDHFVLNSHSLHNHSLIAQFIRNLPPIPSIILPEQAAKFRAYASTAARDKRAVKAEEKRINALHKAMGRQIRGEADVPADPL